MNSAEGFVVLPDSDAGQATARMMRDRCGDVLTNEIRHASGRPWLIGSWSPERVSVVAETPTRVAVLGDSPPPVELLRVWTNSVRSAEGLGAVAANLTGANHLVCSIGGRVRVQGTLAQTRRVFHADIGGCAVAADRADWLATARDAEIDDTALALRLSLPPVPHPLDRRTMWRGVHTVPGEYWLRLDADGTVAMVRRWSPPSAELGAAEATAAVRRALSDAVAARAAAGGTISADLSGGLDSSSLCFLVPRDVVRLVTYRQTSHDPAHDDAIYGALAAAAIPAAEHLVREATEVPVAYQGSAALDADPEAPFDWARWHARHVALARELAGAGSRLHLAGHGGDELFGSMQVALHTMVRRHPVTGVRQLRGQRALRRWPLWPMVRGLLDRGDYASCLRAAARTLTEARPGATMPQFAWNLAVRLPPWVTEHGAELVREEFTRFAEEAAEPLAPLRVQHRRLDHARICGLAVRQTDRLMSGHGVRFAAPYLDDRVIDAVLATRLDVHSSPRRYKPLLVDAMRDVLPAELRTRTSKGEFSADLYVGFERHRADLLELADTSLLAERGLIDGGALRRAVLSPLPDANPLARLDMTLAAERWLRVATTLGVSHETV